MVRLLTVAVIGLFGSAAVWADTWQHDGRPKALQFELRHDYAGKYGRPRTAGDWLQPQFASTANRETQPALHRYDAALTYPLSGKGMNFNLGLNLRVIDGWRNDLARSQTRSFRETVPMFYAAALFDLPFKGLQAGFEGRHSDSLVNPSFDYKAKLSYEWDGGLGLEGGWQHQRYADEELNRWQGLPVSKGLFLDLRLKF